MDGAMSDFHFRFMSFGYKFRDLFSPRKDILKEVGIQPGFHVLDYGCGPGSYAIPIAELVGESGRIYALDIHPLAIQKIQRIASRKALTNVVTIRSDCKTGLRDNSVDAVLMYDTFHALSDPNSVLEELHRVLKSNGVLSFSDHHMKENEILAKVTRRGLFSLSRRGKKTHRFLKEEWLPGDVKS